MANNLLEQAQKSGLAGEMNAMTDKVQTRSNNVRVGSWQRFKHVEKTLKELEQKLVAKLSVLGNFKCSFHSNWIKPSRNWDYDYHIIAELKIYKSWSWNSRDTFIVLEEKFESGKDDKTPDSAKIDVRFGDDEIKTLIKPIIDEYLLLLKKYQSEY